MGLIIITANSAETGEVKQVMIQALGCPEQGASLVRWSGKSPLRGVIQAGSEGRTTY